MRRVTVLPILATVMVGGLIAGRSGASLRADQEPGLALVPTPFTFRMNADRVNAFAQAAEAGLDYVPGEVLVKFKAGVSVVGQSRALLGLRSRPSPAALRWLRGSVAVLRDGGEPDAHILARQLRLQPEVEYAEPNFIRRRHSTPSDPSFSTRQWNMSAIDLPRAWDIQPQPGKDVIVAIIDTGVTTVSQSYVFRTWNGSGFQDVSVPFGVSPDLPGSRLLPGEDFVFFGSGQPVLDMDGHGTHVASTVAQEANNGTFGVGVAYQARIMPLKACYGYWELQFVRSALGITGFQPVDDDGGCSVDAIVEAIRYAADNGAKVINMSLGGTSSTQAERDAITYAVGRGVFVAVSMGNEFEEGNPVNYPAAYAPDIRGLVSVAATGRSGRRAFYSSTGSHAEIAAPGGDSRDGGADGRIWQGTILASDYDPFSVIFPRFNRYSEQGYQGTSMASPHVAGVAAMLVAQGITRPGDIELLLTRTAKDLGASGKDNDFGYGLIQPRAALFGLGLRR
jgi:serine protease